MTDNDFRQRADRVRAIPLETVLVWWGAERDRHDRAQWRTQRGPLSVTGSQFFFWHRQAGAGGAIDLVMHLANWPPREAILWLDRQLGNHVAKEPERHATGPPRNGATSDRSTSDRSTSAGRISAGRISAGRTSAGRTSDRTAVDAGRSRRVLKLPAADRDQLPRVCRYLTERRGLAPCIVQALLDAGKLYADARGNAVFLMVAGKSQRAVGAELRGTGSPVWRGLAPGSCRNAGYFWIGQAGSASTIVLCESAIDAISCHQLDPTRLCLSTAGARPDAPWLPPLIARGYRIACGFDNDPPGNLAARGMLSRHPTIGRLLPPAHDWNDALTGR